MTSIKKKQIIDLLNSYKLCGKEYIEPLNFNKVRVDKDNLPNEIDKLETYVKHCSICELSKIQHSSPFSIGSLDSDIMIVGINCNFLDENIEKMLKNMIEKVLLIDFNNIYITNILKCRVDLKLETLDKSIILCKDYLIKQIELIQPKLIITLGMAFNYLLNNKEDLFMASGNLYKYEGIKVVPLLDLEFIYKNPSYKQDMLNDLQKIRKIME